MLPVLLSVLSVGAGPAAARSSAPAGVAAGDPWVSPKSGGHVRYWDFTLDGEGGAGVGAQQGRVR